MVTTRGGFKFEPALRQIVKKLGSGKATQVGFFSDAEYPDGTKVALVAAVQNFGSPARGIPPRPFFTNFVVDGEKQWPKVMQSLLKSTGNDAAQSLELLGQEMEGELRQSIQQTNAPPLKPATIKRKGSAKPLVDTGRLFGAVTSRVQK